ncbi:DNA primase small subunit [Acanthamoeba castellanii str. Neff]|uniref:DNA primase n=1 Tax=Acanthamoeba castellanii (strain ATCC 30010 / Neff) TaxID=1257118 RepID=L8GNS0_ACACF|nr:DNA primase small subunit [Acanthamoeba castellanii str. Neff]ELR14579.1 DNA primase small subunit [Acanthamoeba castellanii str. Neff]
MSQSPPHKKTKQLEEDSKQSAAEVNPFAAFDFRFLLKTYWAPNGANLALREFSYEIEIGNGETTYSRYNTYANAKEFQDGLQRECPRRIDLGAVFSQEPKDKVLVATKRAVPQEKELVFDIDISDYDDVRRCCKGADICGKCWPLMNVAIKVVDRILREDFGFEIILWVYSGRRGVHCWVCDPRARKLSVEERSAVVEYISVAGQRKQSDKFSFINMPPNLHPTLKQAYDEVLLDYFENTVFPAHLFENEDGWNVVLSTLPNNLRDTIAKAWQEDEELTPRERWDQFFVAVNQAIEKGHLRNSNPVYDIVFTCTYPRLDIQVSKHLHHLLKSPFCVHPGTHRVCVPIDPDQCDDFDPQAVPTVETLLSEIDQFDKRNATDSPLRGKKGLRQYEKTSLRDYVRLFEKTLLVPLRQQAARKADDASPSSPAAAAMDEDW